MIETLTVGELYSNEEIFRSLKVSNAGGIRLSCNADGEIARAVIMTSLPGLHGSGENPYQDRMEGQVLTYTAEGRVGEQSLGGRNSRLSTQKENNFPIHGFALVASRRDKLVGPKRWRYLGLLRYLRHYPDFQIDVLDKVRKVWLFEFAIHEIPGLIPLKSDHLIAAEGNIEARLAEVEVPGDNEIVTSDSDQSAIAFHKAEGVRRKLLELDPRRFELFVKDLLLHCGFVDVCVTRYSADGGVDVNAIAAGRHWAFERIVVQVQAKRWLHSVGRKEVAELRGSLQPHARGTIVTTSHFSKAAICEANEPGKSPIGLINGIRLSEVILEEQFEL